MPNIDVALETTSQEIKSELNEINNAIEIIDSVVDNIYEKVDTEVAAVKSKTDLVGTAGDTGGSDTAGTVMGKLNAIFTNTKDNTTASKTGSLSQKDSYIIGLLENSTYGLSALKSASSNGGSVIKSVQRGTITLNSSNVTTVTISAVNTSKAIVLYGGQTNANSGYGWISRDNARLELSSSTSVKASTSAAPAYDLIVPYQVIEFY